MPGEISKPASLTYWTARSDDGAVLHTGETTPSQVTTTGQPVFEPETDPLAHLTKLGRVADRLPALPTRGATLEPGRYRDGEDVVLVKEAHVRGSGDDAQRIERAVAVREPSVRDGDAPVRLTRD
jgi:hypothetical protein